MKGLNKALRILTKPPRKSRAAKKKTIRVAKKTNKPKKPKGPTAAQLRKAEKSRFDQLKKVKIQLKVNSEYDSYFGI